MALTVPSYPNMHDASAPYLNAYAWMSSITINLANDTGSVVMTINPREEAWQEVPIGSVAIQLGQVFTQADPGASPPVAEVRMPRFDELMQDGEFAQAFKMIGAKLYAELLANSPTFAGGTVA